MYVELGARGNGPRKLRTPIFKLETYNIIILDAICFAPRRHDPGIIESSHSHDVNALAFDGVQVLYIWRKMFDGASGCEGA